MPHTGESESIDPFDAHFKRDAMTGAGVAAIVLTRGDVARGEEFAESIKDAITQLKRTSEVVSESVDVDGWARAIERGLARTSLPLVLVATTLEPPAVEQVRPLFEAINRCDHVYSKRPAGVCGIVARRLGGLVWKVIFGSPASDPHAPLRLHRRLKLAAIPLQSPSPFVNVEIAAKATYFGHLIDEVATPKIDAPRVRSKWRDAIALFRDPVFVFESRPLEDAESDAEGDDRPGGEDTERGQDGRDAGAFEDDHPQGADELRERQCADYRLNRGGEPLRAEEDAREQPHRQHDHVHQPGDGLGAVRAGGDQEADARERQRADDVENDHEQEAAANRHPEAENAQTEQDREVGREESQT